MARHTTLYSGFRVAQRLAAVLAVAFCVAASYGYAAPTIPSIALGLASGASIAPQNPAEIFVQENIDKGYAILNDEKLSGIQLHTEFRDFMLGIVYVRRIGMFTLGPYANRASKADIDAFIDGFTDYAIALYETQLGKYKDLTLKVVGSIPRTADDVVVNGEVTDPARANDPPYKVAFRIRKSADERFVVTDMNIEGIWQALSQRADFTSFLQQHGGRIGELANNLKRRAQVLYTSA